VVDDRLVFDEKPVQKKTNTFRVVIEKRALSFEKCTRWENGFEIR
jgi:hypothetical protein